jgi:hypothetical protein
VYIPPIRGARTLEEAACRTIEKLPAGPEWLIIGDINGHHEEWDSQIERDQRGLQIVEWALNGQMNCMNNGDKTRIERGAQSGSSPDVTFCHTSLSEKLSWETSSTMGSDHKSISITIANSKTTQTTQLKVCWNWKKANWVAYKSNIEKLVEENFPDKASVTERERAIREIILKAAKTHVGLKKINPKYATEGVMDEAIKQECLKRDNLVSSPHPNWEEISNTQAEITLKIKERKKQLWQNKVSEAASLQKMWDLLNRFRGRQAANTKKDGILKYKGKGCVTNISNKARAR